ncbi:hypothetical protein ACQPZZ_09470 [Microbispora sp. CA-135349]
MSDVDRDRVVSPPDARLPVLVVRPREELQVARETLAALGRPAGESERP